MKTIVTTRIEGEGYVAETPHNTDLSGEGDTESHAVNELVAAIHAYGDKPLAWDADAKPPKSKDLIVRHLSACWPANPQQPKPAKTPVSKEQSNV